MLKVNCDFCSRDLSVTGGAIDHRLVLKNEEIPLPSAACIDVYIKPPIDSDKRFCGLGCVYRWAKEKSGF